MQKYFDGIIYKVENKQFNDMIFSFNIPLKDIKKNFIRKIKRESKQIPKNQSDIIMINSWHFGNYIIYSRELIKRNNFNNILGIIIWNKD